MGLPSFTSIVCLFGRESEGVAWERRPRGATGGSTPRAAAAAAALSSASLDGFFFYLKVVRGLPGMPYKIYGMKFILLLVSLVGM